MMDKIPNHHPINKDGLVGWYSYRNTGSISALGTWKDYSGNINNGTCVFDSFVNSQGANFDGLNDYIDFGNNSSLKPTNTRVFSCWTKPNTITNSYNTLTTANDPNYEFGCLLKSNGKLAFYVNTTGGQKNIDGTGTHTLTTGNWYFLLFEYSTSSGLKIYVNGDIDATNSSATSPIITTSGNIFIGNDYYPNRHFDGIIADVQFYSRILNQGEIKQNYLRTLRG